METKEELLKIRELLLESFIAEPDRFLSSMLKKRREIEKFVGSSGEYYTFMEKVRKYLLENDVYKEVREEFETLITRKPDRAVLNRVLGILNNY